MPLKSGPHPANTHWHEPIRPPAAPQPVQHPPLDELRGPLALRAIRSASGPTLLRVPKRAQTSITDRGAPPPRALRAPCTVSRRPKVNANMDASHAHESAPVRAAHGNRSRLPDKRNSSSADRCHHIPQCAGPEIPAPALKCFRLPFVPLPERKWHNRCLPPDKAAAVSSRRPRLTIPRIRLRWSLHRLPKRRQFRRTRAWQVCPTALSWLVPAHWHVCRSKASPPQRLPHAQIAYLCMMIC